MESVTFPGANVENGGRTAIGVGLRACEPPEQSKRLTLRATLRAVSPMRTSEQIRAGLESELDKVTVWPDEDAPSRQVA